MQDFVIWVNTLIDTSADSVLPYLRDITTNLSIKALVWMILGVSLKMVSTYIYNLFASRKILGDLLKNSRIKQIIQRSEYVRLQAGADRILVTQLHNGEKWISKNHIWKLSLFQELSIEDNQGTYRSKIFDKQLNSVHITKLAPLVINVTEKRPVDYVSVAELSRDFIFYKHLKLEKIDYVVAAQIRCNNELFGYMFILFCDGKIPNRDKNIVDNIKILAAQIGEVLK